MPTDLTLELNFLNAVIGVIGSAVLIWISTRFVCGFFPSFFLAILTAIVTSILLWVTDFIAGVVLAGTVLTIGIPWYVPLGGLLILDFIVVGAIYGVMIREPLSSRPIGFGRGLLVALMQVIIVGAFLALVVGGLWFLAQGARHP